MRQTTTIDALRAIVLRSDVAAEIRAIDLDGATYGVLLLVALQYLAQLVKSHERRFVADLQLLREADGADAFQGVRVMHHEEQKITERQLPAREARPRCRGELPAARGRLAFPLPAGRDLVNVFVAAPRAERFPIVIGKANGDELGKCLLIGQTMDALRTERPRLFREKEMLRLCLRCVSCSRGKLQIIVLFQQVCFMTSVSANHRDIGRLTLALFLTSFVERFLISANHPPFFREITPRFDQPAFVLDEVAADRIGQFLARDAIGVFRSDASQHLSGNFNGSHPTAVFAQDRQRRSADLTGFEGTLPDPRSDGLHLFGSPVWIVELQQAFEVRDGRLHGARPLMQAWQPGQGRFDRPHLASDVFKLALQASQSLLQAELVVAGAHPPKIRKAAAWRLVPLRHNTDILAETETLEIIL